MHKGNSKVCHECGMLKSKCGCNYKEQGDSVYLSPNAKKKGSKWWADHPSHGTKMGYQSWVILILLVKTKMRER